MRMHWLPVIGGPAVVKKNMESIEYVQNMLITGCNASMWKRHFSRVSLELLTSREEWSAAIEQWWKDWWRNYWSTTHHPSNSCQWHNESPIDFILPLYNESKQLENFVVYYATMMTWYSVLHTHTLWGKGAYLFMIRFGLIWIASFCLGWLIQVRLFDYYQAFTDSDVWEKKSSSARFYNWNPFELE